MKRLWSILWIILCLFLLPDSINAETVDKDGTVSEQVAINQNNADSNCTEGNHDFGEWYLRKEPNFFNKGQKFRVCQICSKLEIEILPKVDPKSVGIFGDADNNGDVDVFDAVMILEYWVGDIEKDEINPDTADVDYNFSIDMFDAVCILEFYTGIITEFPVETRINLQPENLYKELTDDYDGSQPAYGTYTFTNPHRVSDWYWHQVTCTWTWIGSYWSISVQYRSDTKDRDVIFDIAGMLEPLKAGSHNGEAIKKAIWVYTDGERYIEVPKDYDWMQKPEDGMYSFEEPLEESPWHWRKASYYCIWKDDSWGYYVSGGGEVRDKLSEILIMRHLSEPSLLEHETKSVTIWAYFDGE